MQPLDRGAGSFSRGKGPYQKYPQKKGGKFFLSEFPLLSQQNPKKPTAKDVLNKEIIYNRKAVTEKVLTASMEDVQWKNDPWHIKERYFGTQNYVVQDSRQRYIYEAMLIETKSVQIKHNHAERNNNRSHITHSQCHIARVLHATEWSLDPSRSRILKITGQQYNYWDYMLAWSFAFYYQNPLKKHTWFFTINPKNVIDNSKGFPIWFLYWWEKFSPHVDILPASLKEPWLKWYEYHPKLKGKTTKDKPIGLNLIYYFAEFQIPWIWRWDLEFGFDDLNIPVIYKTFHFKWWEKFEPEDILPTICQKVKEYEAIYKAEQKTIVCPPNNIFEYFLNDVKERYPNLTLIERQIKVTELLKQQFLAHQKLNQPEQTTAQASPEQVSQDTQATTSYQPNINTFQLLEDSQDPNASDSDNVSVEGSDASMADYWDGILTLQEQQLKKQLAKEQKKEKKDRYSQTQAKGLDSL